MSPAIFRARGYRFYFFSREEPRMHVHVHHETGEAKFWLGETDAGRPLFCVVIEFPGGKAYPVTARDMTTKEKRRYAAWKNR